MSSNSILDVERCLSWTFVGIKGVHRLLGQIWQSGHTHLCALLRDALRRNIAAVLDCDAVWIERSP